MKIYPNPVKNYFIVDYNMIQASENISLFVTDINGKIMYNKALDTPQDEIIIRTDEFPTGQYICTIYNNGQPIESKPFTITK